MADKYVAYVGSYTRGESDGIYILDANVEYAYFKVRDSFKINNPSFLRYPMTNSTCTAIVMRAWLLLRFCRTAVLN